MLWIPYFGAEVDHAAIQEYLHRENLTCHLMDCVRCYGPKVKPLAPSKRTLALKAITMSSLLDEATTLRERVFARLFSQLTATPDRNRLELTIFSSAVNREYYRQELLRRAALPMGPGAPQPDPTPAPGKYTALIACPRKLNVRTIMRAALRSDLRAVLTKLPFSRLPLSSSADEELDEALQDLGNSIALEATAAFKDAYYPGVQGVNVPEKHVARVMQAMQRELDREGTSRNKVPLAYDKLPPERQRALAERRRMWFARFGITPRSWKTGYLNLLKVENVPFTRSDIEMLVPAPSTDPPASPAAS